MPLGRCAVVPGAVEGKALTGGNAAAMISPERPGRGGASYTPLACTWHASEQVLSNCALRSPDRNTPTAWAAAAPRAVCAPAPAGFAAASTCLCQPSTSAARYKWCVYKAGMVRQRNCGSRVKTVPKTGRPHPTKKGAGMGEHSEQNCWRADGNREQTNKQTRNGEAGAPPVPGRAAGRQSHCFRILLRLCMYSILDLGGGRHRCRA